jgi:uncharacterized membrane protein
MVANIRPTRIAASIVVVAGVALAAVPHVARAQSAGQAPAAAARSLDYAYFRSSVEPIFLKRRSGDLARCYACHEKTKRPTGLSLESLTPGSSVWTEEQSRRNFETVSKLVVPGNLSSSMFPMHPLAPEAGGDVSVHMGGRQFTSQNDQDFQTVAEWIRGKK